MDGSGTDTRAPVDSETLRGMAASNSYPRATSPSGEGLHCLTASALDARLEEELSRAERHGTELSCLLIRIENIDVLAREHGEELREQALDYAARALRHELRRFDRVGRPSDSELALVLPGADGPRGEIVARRVLDRLRAIKVEAGGSRRALIVSVGMAAWRDGGEQEDLLGRARAAARHRNGEEHRVPGEQVDGDSADTAAGAEALEPWPPLDRPARS